MKKMLFLCTQNACRSQMAEAVVRKELGDAVHTFSAGTQPAQVHPLAVEVLEEIGIDTKGSRSKHIDEFSGEQFDLVVTLCDGAAESCPMWQGQGRRIHVGFDDPAQAQGSREKQLEAFRAVRNEIASRLVPIIRDELTIKA